MARPILSFCLAVVLGWPVIAEGAESGAIVREPRGIIKKKLCQRFGLCENGGFHGGHGGQGGYGGYQGGYGGYQGGYGGGYPINIGISQSQSSANAGGGGFGGFGSGYPNNYQYNFGNPGYGGYPGGFGGGPGYFGNGLGAYNNQFNGNYHGGNGYPGNYGFQGPFGNGFFDEADGGDSHRPEHDDVNGSENVQHNDYNRESYNSNGSEGNYAGASSFASAGRKNQ